MIYGDTKTSTLARKQACIHLKNTIKRAKAELKKSKNRATKKKIQKIQAALFGGSNERKRAQQRCRRSGEVLGHG